VAQPEEASIATATINNRTPAIPPTQSKEHLTDIGRSPAPAFNP
jgi:hypothetical protein